MLGCSKIAKATIINPHPLCLHVWTHPSTDRASSWLDLSYIWVWLITEVLQVVMTVPARQAQPSCTSEAAYTEDPCSRKGNRAKTQLFQMLKILDGGAKNVLSFLLQWLFYRLFLHPSPHAINISEERRGPCIWCMIIQAHPSELLCLVKAPPSKNVWGRECTDLLTQLLLPPIGQGILSLAGAGLFHCIPSVPSICYGSHWTST